MPKFSVCIEMIFRDLPMEERIAKVAEVGMPAVEFWGWENKELDVVQAAAEKHGLTVAAIGGGGGQTMLDPANRDDLVSAVERSIATAERLSCPSLILTTGQTLEGVPRECQHQSIVDGLNALKPLVEGKDIVLTLEPLNTIVDHRGYYLETCTESLDILAKVDCPNIKLLYDIYHMQIMEGNVIQTIEENVAAMGHFHVADVPGRFEPGTGELNYTNIFRRIDATSYQGFVGLEYKPTGDHADSLKQVLAIAGA